MNTWLPYPNYALSAHALSPRLIGQQRIDAIQLLRILGTRNSGGQYRFHPIVGMWRGCHVSLIRYANAMIREWVARGGQDNFPLLDTKAGLKNWGLPEDWHTDPHRLPSWLGFNRLHASHRAALLKKDVSWCAFFDWDEPPVHDLFWPSGLPDAGQYVISPTQEVWLVMEVTDDYSDLRREGRATRKKLPHDLVQTRQWTIAQRA